MNVDLSKVPDLELRKKAAQLWKELAAADQAVEDLDENPDVAEKYRRLREQAYTAYNARLDELAKQHDAERGNGDVFARQEAAEKAYNADDIPVVRLNWDEDDVLCCALSGLPLLEDDDVLNGVNEEVVLRCLLPLPPIEADESDIEEAA